MDGAGNATIVAADIDGGSTDNCNLDNASFTVSPNAFTSADLGPNNVTLTVFDEAGNGQAEEGLEDAVEEQLEDGGLVEKGHVAYFHSYFHQVESAEGF